MWPRQPKLEERIKEWWNIPIYGTNMYKVTKLLQNINKQIRICNKEVFGSMEEKKEKLKIRIE